MAVSTVYAANETPKVKLIFHIDCGPGNGVAIIGDKTSVQRICHFLKPLKEKYDVYVLINPQGKNKENLIKILDHLVVCNMPFVLDILSSDNWSTGSHTPDLFGGYDLYHGISISENTAKEYRRIYGKYFAGMRFHEILSADFSTEASRIPNDDSWTQWYHDNYKLPKDAFFQKEICEPYIKLANNNNMFVFWSDFHWIGNCSWDTQQQSREDKVIALLKKYPKIITIGYANNEPNEESAKRLDSWTSIVSGYTKHGASGFGLSNQTWMRKDYNNTSIDEMISWTKSALDADALIIQFEPIWYWFNMPQYSYVIDDYTRDPKWWNRGIPKNNYRLLEDFLLQYKR